MLKSKSSKVFAIIAIVFLSIAFFLNAPMKTSGDGVNSFDRYSEGIMIANLLYENSYTNNTSFLKFMNPDMTFSNGHTGLYDGIVSDYIRNSPPKENEFGTYLSSLTIHRYIYSIIDNIFGHTMFSLQIMHFINALLLALVLAGILLWIKKITNNITGYILLIVCALFSPQLVMSATNLYWADWSLFLPMLCSILVIESGYFEKSRKFYLVPLMIALLSCFIKEIIYYEFISTIMIAMMVPYIYYTFEKELRQKSILKILFYPALGSLLSFILSSVVKLVMLKQYSGSYTAAIDQFLSPIILRIVGNSNAANSIIAQSASTPLIDVVKMMINFPAVSVFNVGKVSFGLLIVLSVIFSIWSIQFEKRNRVTYSFITKPLIITLCFSLLAPFSWFILARPHVAIHNILVSVTWYCPYAIIAIAFILYTGQIIVTNVWKEHMRMNLTCLLKKYWGMLLTPSIILLLTVLMINGYQIFSSSSNTSDLERQVKEEGIILSEKNNLQIYFYDDSLFYLCQGKRNDVFALHIIPEDKSVLEGISADVGFFNMDFKFKDREVTGYSLFYKSRIAKVPLPKYVIKSIYIGEYSVSNNVITKMYWEDNVNMESIVGKPQSIIIPSELTDSNWENGIHIDGNIILIPGNSRLNYYYIGKKIISNKGAILTIIKVEEPSKNWTYLWLDKKISPEEGYPNKFTLEEGQ